ncbi:MAG: hypothetical protein M1831_003494 [Alyxoria varia]|nr:MAG: hypothetical protein M1831_003494 [Alyxoria varia]
MPDIPTSYSSHPYREIAVSHHPSTSPTATPVIVVTLNRPTQHNAFTATMRDELCSVFPLLSVDDRVKCVVLTGAGRMFCAGADLQRGFQRRDTEAGEIPLMLTLRQTHKGGQVALAIHNCRKPTIAAINGSAVGVGITMTLPCCIRIALSTAKIGFVFARRGLVMEACSSFFLPRLIGYSKAVAAVTTGRTYRADDEKALGGLFAETVGMPEEVLRRALETAEEVAGNVSAMCGVLMRDMMWRGPGSAEETHLLESRVLHGLWGTQDNAEGVKAFMEKRPVRFTSTLENDAPRAYPWWSPVDTSVQTQEPPNTETDLAKAKL